MNRKLHITNFIVVFSIVFALLFQSVHSVEHLAQIVTEKKCVHNETEAKVNFTHHHHGIEKCSLCDFTFSHFTSPIKIAFEFRTTAINATEIISHYQTINPNFEGSSLSLRGPPFFIV
ncbi:hypothetical protein [Flavobacterium sp.]